jgi:hypothetical protein
MALINKVLHQTLLGKAEVIKFQILTYCFLNDIPIADGQLEILTLLATKGKCELVSFCELAHAEGIYKSSQVARNSLNVLAKTEPKKLVIKEGKNKKLVYVNPDLKLQTEGNILLEIKFAFINETDQVQRTAA